MYTTEERRAYNQRYYTMCNVKKRNKEIAFLRARKKEASLPLHTIFDTDQCGYGEIL